MEIGSNLIPYVSPEEFERITKTILLEQINQKVSIYNKFIIFRQI